MSKFHQITQREDLGKGCHTMALAMTRPYQHVKRDVDISIPINQNSKCVVVKDPLTDVKGACTQRKKWECFSQCKPITDTDVDTTRSDFEGNL